MADALIMRIGKLRSVEISPLSSVKRYGGVDQDPVAAGSALGVQSVLDGWVQRSGGRLRVSVRLLDVGNGQQLWADRFDEKLTDIFTLQDVIAERVADSVLETITAGELQQLRHHPTENAEAYQLYVTGWWALTRPGGGNLEQALQYFEQAVARDPNFALAHVCVADCYALLGVFALRAPHEVFPQARVSVLRALAIDAELAEVHAELGHIHSMYDLAWQSAEVACRRAIEINPRSSMAHRYLGLNMIFRGKLDAALISIKRAQSIEPLAANYNANIGMIHYYARRYEEAIAQLEATLRIDDGFDHARSFLGRVFSGSANSTARLTNSNADPA
jgi:tetratricopeptide (TPR) repeat protein